MVNIVRKDNLTDHNVAFQIYIDNNLLGGIMNEEKKSFNLKEGKHIIQVRCQKHKSKILSFDIADGEIVEFRCQPLYKDNILSKIIYQIFSNDIELIINGDYFI